MISALILAAGESKRMGQPKMLMPWGNSTVLGHVLSIFKEAGIQDIVVVIGGYRDQIEESIVNFNVRRVFNADYSNGEMVSSIQCGLKEIQNQTQAILIGLGDQPQVQEGTVRLICETYQNKKSNIIMPSYQMRRGHPWLVARPYWDELLALQSHQSPRDFLQRHHSDIEYVNIDNPTIIADLDTPEDYQKWRPDFYDKLSG